MDNRTTKTLNEIAANIQTSDAAYASAFFSGALLLLKKIAAPVSQIFRSPFGTITSSAARQWGLGGAPAPTA